MHTWNAAPYVVLRSCRGRRHELCVMPLLLFGQDGFVSAGARIMSLIQAPSVRFSWIQFSSIAIKVLWPSIGLNRYRIPLNTLTAVQLHQRRWR
jgi:hypothetical protein